MTVKRKANEAFVDDKHSNTRSSASHGLPTTKLKEKAEKLLKTRQNLPVWPHAEEIRVAVRENDVVLLVGETGSGKSTQIPQFLYTEEWCSSQQPKSSRARIGGRIAIIQPRRVAAVSLASRVASEIGTPLGRASPASQVGYSVRFDTNVGPNSRIKFLTDGMLLQELLRDPWLKEYSCVIVDEVHERGVNVDLILGFLKRILDARLGHLGSDITDGRAGVPLKVVVMSATANMQSIQSFFGEMAAHERKKDDWIGFSDNEDDDAQVTNGSTDAIESQVPLVASCYIKGREHPVTISYASMAVTNIVDSAMDRIVDLHQHRPLPGDILVFLTGQEMIENLEALCQAYAETLNKKIETPHSTKSKFAEQKLPGLQILPLFASLPTDLQSRIFQPTPDFTRRVILSTNIAETSLTVPGVRHVIDTGKHKARLFRPGLNLETLLSSQISQSMAKQRAGRAGREAPGTCHRLYTEADYWKLENDTKPEILSTDLNFLVLTLKAHGIENVLDFPLLTKPPKKSLEASLEGLLNLEALDLETGQITEVGRKMAMLPVRADLARVLLEGSKYSQDVLAGVIDIVAALSLEEGIFLPTGGNRGRQRHIAKKEGQELFINKTPVRNGNKNDAESEDDSDSESSNPIESARRELISRHSDHLTLLNAVGKYNSPEAADKRAWCDKYKVSHRGMRRISEIRKQLSQMMSNKKYRLESTVGAQPILNGDPQSLLSDMQRRDSILKCIAVGSWQNIALLSSLGPVEAVQSKLNPNQRLEYTTLLTKQPIAIHPSSPAFKRSGGSAAFAVRKEGASKKKGERKPSSTMPPCIIFTDLIYTSKPYARNVSAIDLSWLAEIGRIA